MKLDLSATRSRLFVAVGVRRHASEKKKIGMRLSRGNDMAWAAESTLLARLPRPADKLAHYPVSTERILKPQDV